MNRVVIVGAGPCGILLAHYLLRRGSDKYQVEIYERRSDPRKVPLSNSRSIPYGISERGLRALRKIEGLEEEVKVKCAENTGVILHQENGKTLFQRRRKTIFATNRTSLILTLLSKLTEQFDSSRVKVHFDCKCTEVDLKAKTVKFEKVKEVASGEETGEFTVDYDLLIGVDGARSVVRTHLLGTEFFEFEQKYVPCVYKTVFLPRANNLKSNCLHVWKPWDGITFGAIPQLDESFIGILFFPHSEKRIVGLSTKEEVIAFFSQNIPEVSQLISESEAEAFLNRTPSAQLKIRCNRYHYGDSVLIMGDAAHAVSSALAQGCNAALEDVLVLDTLLDKYSDNWAKATEQFTIHRKPDADALAELDTNVSPLSKALSQEFYLRESFASMMNSLFPKLFLPPLREMISDTTLPYSEVLKSYQRWVSKVRKSNEKLLLRNLRNDYR